MFKKISHVAIAVKNLDDAIMRYTQVLGMINKGTEVIADQKVTVAMLPVGESRLELVQGTDNESAVSKYVESHGEGIHHIALEVEDIDYTLNVLKYAGLKLIDEKPRIGAEGAKIAFVHPKGLNGVLLELIQPKAQTSKPEMIRKDQEKDKTITNTANLKPKSDAPEKTEPKKESTHRLIPSVFGKKKQ